MDYASLIAEFGANYGLGDLVPDEDGAVGFEADGRTVVLQKLPDSENVIVTVRLGEAVSGSEERVNRILLQANQSLMTLDGMALCLHPETGDYRLLSRLDVASLDFIAFDKIMETILDRAEQWGALLRKIIPIASSNAAALAESNGEDAAADKESAPSMTGWDALRQMGSTTFA